MNKSLPVYDLTPFTMLDFPDKAACIVWLAGCNMRCPYCHNPGIVKGGSGKWTADHVLDFLAQRRGLLDGVVLSGGEATLYAGIIGFARAIKNMGFAIKLDTNGTRPAIVRQMIGESLLDYVALDYKAPGCKFKAATGIKNKKPFDETLALLCGQKSLPVEIRTTIHTSLLDEKDIADIIDDLGKHDYHGKYFIQNFRQPDHGTLGDLCAQSRQLRLDTIARPRGFDIGFRNF